MPKILRIINRFNLGGPTYNAAYLSKYISDDFETLLVGGVKEDAEESSEYILENLGLKPLIIPEMRRSLNPTSDFNAYRRISKIIKEFKPDIVHTHASKAGTVGRMAAARHNVPVIVHTFHGHVFHSYFGSAKTKMIINIEQGLAEQTSKIIAISDKQKDELVNTFKIAGEDKFEVIPLGFDLSRFRQNNDEKRLAFRKKYNVNDNELAIGIVGRLAPVKNHKLFIEAIKRVKNETNQSIRAFIIGDGELKQELVDFCKVMNLSYTIPVNGHVDKADVTFTSWIKDIDKAYPGIDIVAMTSLNEGTPVSLIEAQAANRPIVTTNVGGIENIVVPDKTALLTRNNDVEDFTSKLLQMVENEKIRNEQMRLGWEQVKNKFHYTRLVKDMENLYYRLLSEVK
jgi:glycosyltransferase involved in cell wall biosynthesis